MILSIDRILQLLADRKSVEKIAELSDVDVENVCIIINEARELLNNTEKAKTRKKIILRRKEPAAGGEEDPAEDDINLNDDIFVGAELSTVPLASTLLVYTDGASSGNPGPAGIGIVINDKEDRTVGKVSFFIGNKTNNFAEYSAIIRALKIAIYYKTKDLKIRTDSELVVKQVKGEYKVSSPKIKPLYDEVIRLKRMINSCRIEHVTRSLNDKADYLAKKAVETYLNTK
jgi:ribonuclease HI